MTKYMKLDVPAHQLFPGMVILEGRVSIHGDRNIKVDEIIPYANGCRKTHVNGTLCYEPDELLTVAWPVEAENAIRNRQERLSELQTPEQGNESIPSRKKRKQKAGR